MIEILSPKEYYDQYNNGVIGIDAIRQLFRAGANSTDKNAFPSEKVGNRYYVSREAAENWWNRKSGKTSEINENKLSLAKEKEVQQLMNSIITDHNKMLLKKIEVMKMVKYKSAEEKGFIDRLIRDLLETE